MHDSTIYNRTLIKKHQAPLGSYAGSLLTQHPIYNKRGYAFGDKFFKETCCNEEVMGEDHNICDKFVARRPTDCGDKYEPPLLGELCNIIAY